MRANGGMGDVAASVGFVGWAFAAMCDHALFHAFYTEGGFLSYNFLNFNVETI